MQGLGNISLDFTWLCEVTQTCAQVFSKLGYNGESGSPKPASVEENKEILIYCITAYR